MEDVFRDERPARGWKSDWGKKRLPSNEKAFPTRNSL